MGKSLAVITGASSGIGMVFARRLAAHYDLLLVARRQDSLEALARELTARHGSTVAVLAADLSDELQLSIVADRIASEPTLALLINNAGFGLRGAFWETDLGVLEKMHRLHVTATLRLTHAALGVLVAQNRGAVINVASVAAFAQRAGSACYGATKSWLASFTEGLFLDLKRAESAVTVQALCPGFTYSGFHDVMREDRFRLAPASFWMTAEDVVEDSLQALARGSLIVVPGWRYRLLVAILTKLPIWLKLRLEASGTRRTR
ncbi:MAG: short-chain dehydrogenase/reductase [Gammaproteobacteria bacterium]|nr:short-chain dehydrogenase/reductase [Gammaproteobacteria bacterium]